MRITSIDSSSTDSRVAVFGQREAAKCSFSASPRTVHASKDEPQYLVRSDNGGEAVHKPEALTGL